MSGVNTSQLTVAANSSFSATNNILDWSTDGKGDWIPLPNVTTNGARQFPITGIQNYAAVGDKFRWNSGGLKYGYVSAVTTNLLTVYAGDVLPPVSSAVTSVAISKGTSPFGHPIYLSYSPSTGATGSMSWKSPVFEYALFSMHGKQVLVVFKVEGEVEGTPDIALLVGLPIEGVVSSVGCAHIAEFGLDTAVGQANMHTTESVYLRPADGGVWELGMMGATCSISYWVL